MITQEKIDAMMADIGIRPDMAPHMPYLATEASKASFIIELGVEYGNGTTFALSEGLRYSDAAEKLMISIDIDDVMTTGRKPVEDWWHFILGNDSSVRVIDEISVLAGSKKADIIFVDAFHKPYHVADELNCYLQFSGDNTIWYFHDVRDNITGEETDIVSTIKNFATQNGLTYELISIESCGLAKMYKA